MSFEGMNKQDRNVTEDTIREPNKEFGPTGTLKIQAEGVDESGVYERGGLPVVHVPPKSHVMDLEPKVIINDDVKKLVELRGGVVELVPMQEQRFDLDDIETNLGRVQMAIRRAQESVGKAETPEARGMGMKKLTELGREKAALEAQLPFARKDELKNVESEYEVMVARYQELIQKLGKQPTELDELNALSAKIPLAKAHRDQLKQSRVFRKEKMLSTDVKNQSAGNKVVSWFKSFLGKK
jgi:hypothetical protein